jgi:hypothetical protein
LVSANRWLRLVIVLIVVVVSSGESAEKAIFRAKYDLLLLLGQKEGLGGWG